MSQFVVAETEYGKVKGVEKLSVLSSLYVSFTGIPFAAPPIGSLRFKDPQKPIPWSDVLDATEEKPGCLGIDSSKAITGSEDCLYLNIFTKSVDRNKRYPVLVFIHGGVFYGGNSSLNSYSPDYLLMADVVVVTFNYRVGPLGFLYLYDSDLNVPGNAGLKDQLMALKFVKENITKFGGDPYNITAIGHSAGAVSLTWHCVSEKSKNLFNKAIIMSGSVFIPGAISPNRDWAARLAKMLGHTECDNEASVLQFLQNADPIKMIQVQRKLIRPDELNKILLAFLPHVEPYITENTFISQRPIDLMRTAWSNDIDVVIGGTPDEGLMFLQMIREMPAVLAAHKLENMVPYDFAELSSDDPIRLEFAEKLRQTYYSSSSCDPTKDELGYCKLQTDYQFWHGVHRFVQGRQNSGGNGKTFLYHFAVDSPIQNHRRIRLYGDELRGVCHGDELSYLFKNIYGDVPERHTIEFKSIERFVSVFTSFAQTGNPNSNVINADMENVTWHEVNSQQPPYKCLNIDEHLSFEELPLSSRLSVWDEIYERTKMPLY